MSHKEFTFSPGLLLQMALHTVFMQYPVCTELGKLCLHISLCRIICKSNDTMSFKLILVNPIPKNLQMMGLYMLPSSLGTCCWASLTPLRFEPTDYHLNIIIISILQDFATKTLEIAEETFENQQVCILVPQTRDIATRNTFRSSFENNVFDNSASCDHSYKKMLRLSLMPVVEYSVCLWPMVTSGMPVSVCMRIQPRPVYSDLKAQISF